MTAVKSLSFHLLTLQPTKVFIVIFVSLLLLTKQEWESAIKEQKLLYSISLLGLEAEEKGKRQKGGGVLLSHALQASPDLFSQASLVRQQSWLCFCAPRR